ncbi:MAG: YcxB family protein [Cytophagales bacterium]|nr:MAG: YcxB family protein [Cytophagales bacterium]
MIIKTKKYQLEKKLYIKISMLNFLKKQWYIVFAPIVLAGLLYFSWWWMFAVILIPGLYILFWFIQFYGVTMMPDSQMMFDKYMFEIDSRQILVKLNTKQGMQITWDKITGVEIRNDAYMLMLSKAQFFYLPFKIFNTETEIKFLESIMKRKELIK